jgi:hypothetical protein
MSLVQRRAACRSRRDSSQFNGANPASSGESPAEELAELAWKAAREGEPWAIQMIYNRLEPQPAQFKLTHEVDNGNPID